MSCAVCKSNIAKIEDRISCKACNNFFHVQCVGVKIDYFNYYIKERKRPWYCTPCYADVFASKNDVLKMVETLSNEFHKALDVKLTKVAHQIVGAYQQHILTIVDEKEEVLQRELSQTRNDVTEMVARVKKLETNSSDCKCAKKLEHFEKKKSLLVTNLPVIPGENLRDYVIKIANICDIDLEPNEIEKTFRLKQKSLPTKDNSKPMNQHKPPPILVKFVNTTTKQNIFERYIKDISNTNYLTAQKLGLSENRRIFINNHIVNDLKPTLNEALKLRKEKKLTALHTHTDFLTIKVNEKWIRIESTKQLKQLFENIT